MALALGEAHDQREACRQLLSEAAQGDLELHASVEAIQELLHHRMRKVDRRQAVSQVQRLQTAIRLHTFDHQVLAGATELVAATALRGRDAVHAATALIHGFDAIVTTDRDFHGLPGLARIDPSDALA